jgi:S-DNA-T family DNA segregation ATPase FtsK/SpoIIIE
MEYQSFFESLLIRYKVKAHTIYCENSDFYISFYLKLFENGKIKDLERIQNELALELKCNLPIISIINSDGIIKMEFIRNSNKKSNLFDILTNNNLPEGELLCLLGQENDKNLVWMDLSKNPHLLISGTTGSGKSTLLHNIIANIVNYNDAEVFIIDPKLVEFDIYENYFNNITVINSYQDTVFLLEKLNSILDNRLEYLRSNKELKPIVLIIDEFSELSLQDDSKDLYLNLCRLAQRCRAAKIHIILSTQRPSYKIIDGNIKANFPARIACRVTSSLESRIILEHGGAEKLLGNGDALLVDNDRKLLRFKIAFTSSEEVCSFLGKK